MVVELEGVVIDEVALTFRSKNPHEGEIPDSVASVELEGIEPSSEQGKHTLSTCLSWSSFS